MKEHSSLVVFEQSLALKKAGGKLLAVLALGLGLTLALVWLLGASLRVARAASFTVNTTADDYNGSCAGTCSLRDAIVRANQNGQRNTISLGSGTYVLTRTGTNEDAGLTGDLDITSTRPLTIEGVGAEQTIINANGIDRVLDIHPGAGTVVISGVTIYNGNSGNVEGGGIRNADADLLLINTVVMSNAANTFGGGVYVNQGSATVNGGQIALNTANYGGGVYVNQGSATVNGGQIALNTANYGGGVYVEQSTAIFTQTGVSTITLNTATWYGGGVYVDSGRVTLSGGQIVTNTAYYGGGVYVASGNATLSGGQIVRNTATQNGGGMFVYSGAAILSGGQIVSNTASSGGGVYVTLSTAAFTQTGISTITLNTGYDGGGVFVVSGRVTLNGGQIASNTATQDGGGVYVYSGTATLDGGQIVGNTAQNGGGTYIYKSTAAFTQTGASLIALNTATWGGGVNVHSGAATLSGGQIISNTALAGGGVYVWAGVATLSGGQIVSNTAQLGGGVYLALSTGTFTQTGASLIALNTANDSGGGMYVYSGAAMLSGGQIVSNTAQFGGGIYNYTATLALVNTTVSNNHATDSGGGLFSNGGTSVLTYTTIASNTATGGAGGINLGGGTVFLQDTIVADNGTNCNTGLISNGHNLEDGHTCGLVATGDMTDTSPLLGPLTADGRNLVHPLLAGSPAIDHGVCIVGITTDQRGLTRPQGFACDIGAYEKTFWKVYLPLTLK